MLYCPYLEITVLISNHVNVIHYFPGAYVPLTVEGKIIVDGVLASCYADLSGFVLCSNDTHATVFKSYGVDFGK